MIKSILRHNMGRNDLSGIKNCHVEGLHSIMLNDAEGNRMRLYFSEPESQLIYNNISAGESRSTVDADGYAAVDSRALASYLPSMTLGVHGHRTEVRLVGVLGRARNHSVRISQMRSGTRGMRKYNYESAIDGQGSITPTAEFFNVVSSKTTVLSAGVEVLMAPEDLHTISTAAEPGDCAWMVFERGERAADTGSHFYSYNLSAEVQQTGLYQPMDSATCSAILAYVLSRVVAHEENEARRAALMTQEAAANERRTARLARRSAQAVLCNDFATQLTANQWAPGLCNTHELDQLLSIVAPSYNDSESKGTYMSAAECLTGRGFLEWLYNAHMTIPEFVVYLTRMSEERSRAGMLTTPPSNNRSRRSTVQLTTDMLRAIAPPSAQPEAEQSSDTATEAAVAYAADDDSWNMPSPAGWGADTVPAPSPTGRVRASTSPFAAGFTGRNPFRDTAAAAAAQAAMLAINARDANLQAAARAFNATTLPTTDQMREAVGLPPIRSIAPHSDSFTEF